MASTGVHANMDDGDIEQPKRASGDTTGGGGREITPQRTRWMALRSTVKATAAFAERNGSEAQTRRRRPSIGDTGALGPPRA